MVTGEDQLLIETNYFLNNTRQNKINPTTPQHSRASMKMVQLFSRGGKCQTRVCFCLLSPCLIPSINFISLLNRHYVKMRQDGPGIFKFCRSKVSPSALLLPIAGFNRNLSYKLPETPAHIKLVATL